MRRFLFPILLCGLSIAAHGAEEGAPAVPSLEAAKADCKRLQSRADALDPNHEGSQDMLLRSGSELCWIDAALQERTQSIRKTLAQGKAGTLANEFQSEQSAWRQFRDQTCLLANLGEGAASWPRVHATYCKIAYAKARLKSLETLQECLLKKDWAGPDEYLAANLCSFGEDTQEQAIAPSSEG